MIAPSQLEDGHAGRWERRLRPAAERSRDPPQSGWCPTTTTVSPATGDGRADVVRRRAGRELAHGLRRAEAEASTAVSRARNSGLERTMSGATPSSRSLSPSCRACSRPSASGRAARPGRRASHPRAEPGRAASAGRINRVVQVSFRTRDLVVVSWPIAREDAERLLRGGSSLPRSTGSTSSRSWRCGTRAGSLRPDQHPHLRRARG